MKVLAFEKDAYRFLGHTHNSKNLYTFKNFSASILLLLFSILITSCSNDFENYFKRPSWLEESAYDALNAKGNFTNYLSLVDRTRYSSVLKGSGSYTIFAPNDAAFKIYLAGNSYTSVSQIPDTMAAKIVAYSLVYNSYTSEYLGDIAGSTWTVGGSVRKLTPYYKGLYQESVNGITSWVIDPGDQAGTTTTLANSTTKTSLPYRYLPIFTPIYKTTKGVTNADYETFYPGLANSESNGINVMGAGVHNQSNDSAYIAVENGVVYETNRVNSDMRNIDERLKDDSNYSKFLNILNRQLANGSYQFITYTENTDQTSYYKKAYPSDNISHLYYKHYTLPFGFNIEAAATTDVDNQSDATTLFVPSTSAINSWIAKQKSIYGYSDESDIPTDAWTYFMQAHMVGSLVWPSAFTSAQNENGEYVNGLGTNGTTFANFGITKSQMASNGFLYDIGSCVRSGYFESVYAPILMNSNYNYAYLLMNNIYSSSLSSDFLRTYLKGYLTENITLLVPGDDLITADGYSYDSSKNLFTDRFSNSLIPTGTTTSAMDRIERMLTMGVFERNTSSIIPNFTAQTDGIAAYNGYGFATDYYGDMVRYKNNQLQWCGNVREGTTIQVIQILDGNGNNPYINGQVFKESSLPNYSLRNTDASATDGWDEQSTLPFVTNYLAGNTQVSSFYKYWKALNASSLLSIPDARYYTILIPDNNAISNAVAAGVLPSYSSWADANGNITDATKNSQVLTFIYNHFLDGTVFPDDGRQYITVDFLNNSSYTVSTLQSYTVNNETNKSKVTAYKDSGNFLNFKANDITDGSTTLVKGSGTVQVERVFSGSNIIGPRCVIHQVNGYLNYTVN